jgi:hypothetical protein
MTCLPASKSRNRERRVIHVGRANIDDVDIGVVDEILWILVQLRDAQFFTGFFQNCR